MSMQVLVDLYKRVVEKVPDAAVADGTTHVLAFDNEMRRWRIVPKDGGSGGLIVTAPLARAAIVEHWLEVALRRVESTELSFLPAWTRPGAEDENGMPNPGDVGFLVLNAANHPGACNRMPAIEAWGHTKEEALGEYLIEVAKRGNFT